MKLYVIKDQTATFWISGRCGRGSELPVALEPVVPECEDSKEYCKIIAKIAAGGSCDHQEDFQFDRQLRAFLTIIPTSTSAHGDGRIQIYDLYHTSPLFGTLISLFSKANFSFHLIVKEMNIKYSCGCVTPVDLESNDNVHVCNTYVLFNDIKFPEHERHPDASMEYLRTPQCRMTLTVKFNYDALAKVPLKSLGFKGERLLNEAIGSDLVVVAANGAEVKCHKCALMVSSDAFRAMFESKMKEEKSNRLELLDMSEAGVRGFLNFIYSSDLRAASESCDIALELFQTGDKYQMSSLITRLKMLICSKPAEWFSVDMAVGLSLRVQNMKEKDEIWKKTMEVLKWYSRNSEAELIVSEEYQELSRNEDGMEFFRQFRKLA